VQLQGAPPPPAATGRTASPAAQVIGNAESHVYHAPDCARLPARDKQVTFNSAAEAKKAGYRPHAACMGTSGAR
jgi:methylphosphotriester-DNA--protein-cysteine methyltransferase